MKALLLFLAFNLVFALWCPTSSLGQISFYNWVFPGRNRLPYGEIPEKAYNLSIYNLEAMFASHELSCGSKPPDEYRVIFIGDSSTWGFLQEPSQTLTVNINKKKIITPNGFQVRAYNLGYPVMSLMKDLLILSSVLQYEPDLIIWLFTLESFPYDKQLYPPLLQNNPVPVKALIDQYNLKLDRDSDQFIQSSFYGRTIAGSRRELADLIRLQLFGVLWAATGIDQYIPEEYTARMEDLSADMDFHNLKPPDLQTPDLALDILSAGITMAGDIPILMINEPMFISQGKNSHIRYNFYYPRWAYEDYRQILVKESTINQWNYLDMWDQIPASEFTNSAVHLSPEGSDKFAQLISEVILDFLKGTPTD